MNSKPKSLRIYTKIYNLHNRNLFLLTFPSEEFAVNSASRVVARTKFGVSDQPTDPCKFLDKLKLKLKHKNSFHWNAYYKLLEKAFRKLFYLT